MPQVWFTADTHFGNPNIVKLQARPFLSQAELELHAADPHGDWKVSRETIRRHDDALIEGMNELVAEDDTLWVLGDFCSGKFREATRYLERLRCQRINLVWGNHDHRTIGVAFSKTIEQGMITVQGQMIWLNHYPMRSWNRSLHGSWHLYGHVHGRFAKQDEESFLLTRDVGVDACDYRPVSFDQVAHYMRPRVELLERARERYLNGDHDDFPIA